MTLAEDIQKANKMFGENTLTILSSSRVASVDVIPTGIASLDVALGVGGIPRGKITEIYGGFGCGKSTICLQTIVQAQKLGLKTLYIDAEHALNINRVKQVGVDPDNLVLIQPMSGEQAFEAIEWASNEGFGLIIVDSVANLTPTVEMEKDYDEVSMGGLARLMSKGMRKITPHVSIGNTAVIFINQTRSNIGVYGGGVTTTGGNGLKFAASVRIALKNAGKIYNSSNIQIGDKFRAEIIKNKLAMPFQTVEYEINEYGVDDTPALITKLKEAGVITVAGSWIKYKDENIAHGKDKLIKKLHEDSELKETLLNDLKTVKK